MSKLLTLLNMVVNISFCSAMSTETNKKLFLQQVEQILEGVMDDKDRVSSRPAHTIWPEMHHTAPYCIV